jgi:hypothetical protein
MCIKIAAYQMMAAILGDNINSRLLAKGHAYAHTIILVKQLTE